MNFLKNYTQTENGALTHSSTDNAVLDFFSRAGAMRGQKDEVLHLFDKAFAENSELALKATLWLRDIRGGAGERQLYRDILVHLASCNAINAFSILAQNTPEFGTWEDITDIIEHLPSVYQHVIIGQIGVQLKKDERSENPSLLAKWLPSENAGTASKSRARLFRTRLGYTSRGWRRLLTALRSRQYIVERDMSAQRWNEIDYKKVASRANLIYKDAFMKHDEDRYIEALGSLKSTTIMPYELYKKSGKMDHRVLEALWNNLPNYMNEKNILVLADVSGSMSGDPMAVSVSLALYAAQRTKGLFQGSFITFETTPRIMNIDPKLSVKDTMRQIEQAPWGGSTNIIGAFELILGLARKHNIPQDEMPAALFVISDMEFNSADRYYETNHESIKRRFAEAGYSMPLLVFWNVNARNQQSPVTQSEKGTVLISGLSATLFKNVLALDFSPVEDEKGGQTVELTPMEAMLQILNSGRYDVV